MVDGYIKRQMAERGIKDVEELLIQSKRTDPFYIEDHAQVAKAEWFGPVFEQYVEHLKETNPDKTPHLRGGHYWYQALGDVAVRWNGKPYVNDDTCWTEMQDGARYARYLGHADTDDFVDKRNPELTRNVKWGPRTLAGYSTRWDTWKLPNINAALTRAEIELPTYYPYSEGYGFYSADEARAAQPYHLEVWCEKSSMDEILQPLCSDYAVNYVPFKGTPSITAGTKLLQRAGTVGKPVRVFYISDYDPQGRNMPIVVARHIQYWEWYKEMGFDIKIYPIILTADQVGKDEYDLPHAPDNTNVELDALEALHPGELRKIVKDAIINYYDFEVKRAYNEYQSEAWSRCRRAESEYIAPFAGKRDELLKRINDATEPYRVKINELQKEFDVVMGPFQEELDGLNSALHDCTASNEMTLPDPPEVDADADELGGALYDSDLDYEEQFAILKAAKPPKQERKSRKKSVNDG